MLSTAKVAVLVVVVMVPVVPLTPGPPRHPERDADDEDGGDELEVRLRGLAAPLLVSRGGVDEVVGVLRKQDLLDQMLDGRFPDVATAMRSPNVVHEAMTVVAGLEAFHMSPVQMAIVVDEYGSLEGIVTQTNLLEAIAGDIPDAGEEPDVVEREDGSLLMDGMMPAEEAFERLAFADPPDTDDYTTLAGYVIFQLGRIPGAGDAVEAQGWRLEVVDMDGRRIDKVLATRLPDPAPTETS